MYRYWNLRTPKLLWILTLIGMLCALPLVYARHETETSTKNVEFVFDYRDLLDIADMKADPKAFVDGELGKMKDAGIGSLAVYESTLQELKESRRIDVFSAHEAASLTQGPVNPGNNFTYVVFTEPDTQPVLQAMITDTFTSLGVPTRPWTYKGQPGLIIEMGVDEASLKPMDPDPFTMQKLKAQGFHLVVRLSNRRPFDAQKMDKLLAELQKLGVTRIIVDGDEVPGYGETSTANLGKMAYMLRAHGIGLAAIELLKTPQKGFSTLAKDTFYNVVRLHSFTEKDGEKLTETGLKKSELDTRIQGVADRFVLAVKDRNIRMVFLNAKPGKNIDKGVITDPLNALYASLNGPDGAVKRVQSLGFQLAPAKPFQIDEMAAWQKVARVFILLGGVALIALTVSYFLPQTALGLFVIGTIGAIGLRVLSGSLYAQGLALAVAICAPTLAVMLAIRRVQSGRAAAAKSQLGYALLELVRSSLISLIGVVYVVSLLNNITYMLVLQQFRGVSLLHLVPIALIAVYLLFFSEKLTAKQRVARLRTMLAFNINVLWVIIAVLVLAGGYYYLSRTGNEGQASGFELLFRSFLENVLQVRPRSKEFLFAHPVFLLGAYLAVKHRSAAYLYIIAVMGQLSIVDTFCHLHTPLHISLIRITYGVVFGTLIGLVFIAVWKLAARSWKRWSSLLRE
ncbi:membrane protein [Gordoniibacillus kamchatkensis]|uniref:Membrane protein n=1 Tax=Gordoniibacillus kamchatkensis TaxID=1590651 RepID=A0ABR5AHX8_9BACL|nr:DUF5693 family protein [Paenibacillus sp. VKM B-2647]KIL40636.1 membrane protein [Paenibacillus sp. VKM B-2647]